MTNTFKTLIVSALAIATATTAFAHDGKGGKGFGGRGMDRPEFSELDTNGDGQLTAAELQAFHANKFAEMDADGNGEISADELSAKFEQSNSDRAERMIEKLDEDNSGGLSQEELKNRGRGGDDEDRAAKMIERADENGDGQISEEEFAEMGGRGRK